MKPKSYSLTTTNHKTKDVERLNHFELVGSKVGKAEEIIRNTDLSSLGIDIKKIENRKKNDKSENITLFVRSC